MFDDEFMNDMILNPDLYGLEDDEESRQNDEDEESRQNDEDEESEDDEE